MESGFIGAPNTIDSSVVSDREPNSVFILFLSTFGIGTALTLVSCVLREPTRAVTGDQTCPAGWKTEDFRPKNKVNGESVSDVIYTCIGPDGERVTLPDISGESR